ncbi:MAG: hypothetical protein LC745_07085 [Planctomycetia bacterium]|nr:hypothetical protein [Planctomycetia bacterium]
MVTEAPLKGLGLAREAGTVFAWDDADRLYQLDLKGEYRSVARAPGKVTAASVSDDGSRIALLGEGSRLWLLDADLGVVAERQAPPDPVALAVDPHGRYVVVSSRLSTNHFYNRFGKPAGRFETLQPLSFFAFVSTRPLLIGCAAYGLIVALELGGSATRLSAEPIWVDRQVSGLGRLSTTGDGAMILASCFTHGVQRYDAHGQNAGAYHLGGTATLAVPDVAGRVIAVATAEGELAILNSAGNVRWKSGLPRPAIALETDPLGRYLIYGQATGEIVRLDLYAGERPATRPEAASPGTPASSTSRAHPGVGSMVRKPDWVLPVASSDDQAETAVVTVLDDPPRVGLLTSSLRLQIVNTDGRNLGFAPDIAGVGRILRTAPGWIAAATDRQVVLFHASKNAAQRLDLSLVEVTHMAVRPDTFGIALVQERDRIGRATIAGRWIWKQELKTAVEDIAIGPDGYSAMTTDSGSLTVFDPAGLAAGFYQADPSEPLSLIEAVDGAPAGVVWMTLARRAEVLRGHDLRGRVVWESPVPWEGWQFQRLGPVAAVAAPDGRVLVYDGAGHLRGHGKASDGSKDVFGTNPQGEVRRVSRQGVHLICADLDGRVRWRCVCDEPLGPIAVGRSGVAVMIGRSLSWFHHLA